MQRTALTLTLTAALGAGAASATEAWKVVEGAHGGGKGVWSVTVSGDRLSGNADMFGPRGQPLKYRLIGKLENGVYTAQRVSPSDGVDCMYRGTKRLDGAISGAAICGAQTGVWTVEPSRK